MAWAAGDAFTIAELTDYIQAGTTNISFTSQTAFTQNVTFTTAFTATPVVLANLNSGSGVAAHWMARAITPSTTGFTIFVFADTGAAAQTWSNIPVSWIAINP